MKLPKILIATGNKGKFKEITELLNSVNIDCVGAFDYDLKEPIEDGQTFEENSLIKAKYYANKTGLVALADDSGLCIEALDGQPGIHSARWAINEKTGQKDFNIAFDKIVKELEKKGINYQKEPVKAYFICNLTLFNPKNNQHQSFEGRVDGILTFPAKGEKGFGYDPIFVSNIFGGKTFGEVEYAQKEKVSHRSHAFLKFQNFFSCKKSKMLF